MVPERCSFSDEIHKINKKAVNIDTRLVSFDGPRHQRRTPNIIDKKQ